MALYHIGEKELCPCILMWVRTPLTPNLTSNQIKSIVLTKKKNVIRLQNRKISKTIRSMKIIPITLIRWLVGGRGDGLSFQLNLLKCFSSFVTYIWFDPLVFHQFQTIPSAVHFRQFVFHLFEATVARSYNWRDDTSLYILELHCQLYIPISAFSATKKENTRCILVLANEISVVAQDYVNKW